MQNINKFNGYAKSLKNPVYRQKIVPMKRVSMKERLYKKEIMEYKNEGL